MPNGLGRSKSSKQTNTKQTTQQLSGVQKPTRARRKKPPATIVPRVTLARAVKAVKVNVAPIASCAFTQQIAARPDSTILTAHLDAIEKHRQRFLDRIAVAQLQKKKKNAAYNTRISGDKGKVTEAIGEYETTVFMVTQEPNCALLTGFSAGVGIDQIWYDKTQDRYVIVEAKGPGATLSTNAAKGDQMSKQWVRNSLEDIKKSKSSDAAEIDHAKKMLKAMDDGPPPRVEGMVITAKKGGGSVSMSRSSIPDGGIYHAT